MGEMKSCDLRDMEGQENKAIGWYIAEDKEEYDVCKKHAKDVKKGGLKLELYEEEDDDNV